LSLPIFFVMACPHAQLPYWSKHCVIQAGILELELMAPPFYRLR